MSRVTAGRVVNLHLLVYKIFQILLVLAYGSQTRVPEPNVAAGYVEYELANLVSMRARPVADLVESVVMPPEITSYFMMKSFSTHGIVLRDEVIASVVVSQLHAPPPKLLAHER